MIEFTNPVLLQIVFEEKILSRLIELIEEIQYISKNQYKVKKWENVKYSTYDFMRNIMPGVIKYFKQYICENNEKKYYNNWYPKSIKKHSFVPPNFILNPCINFIKNIDTYKFEANENLCKSRYKLLQNISMLICIYAYHFNQNPVCNISIYNKKINYIKWYHVVYSLMYMARYEQFTFSNLNKNTALKKLYKDINLYKKEDMCYISSDSESEEENLIKNNKKEIEIYYVSSDSESEEEKETKEIKEEKEEKEEKNNYYPIESIMCHKLEEKIFNNFKITKDLENKMKQLSTKEILSILDNIELLNKYY
jgi:hypothetical protein